MYNWMKCTDGHFGFIRKEPVDNDSINEQDLEAWYNVYDQYIQHYGLGSLYTKYLETLRKLALTQIEYVISRDRFKLTKIEVEEAKLNKIMANKGQGISIDKSLIRLSKWMGFKLDLHTTTVKEYFNILEDYGKANQT